MGELASPFISMGTRTLWGPRFCSDFKSAYPQPRVTFRAAHRRRSRRVTGTVDGCRTRTVEDPGACVRYGVRQNRRRTDPSLDGRLRPSYDCTVSQIQVRHRGHKFLKEDVSRRVTCMCRDTLLILGSILRCAICLPPPFFFAVTIASTRDFAQSCRMYEKCWIYVQA